MSLIENKSQKEKSTRKMNKKKKKQNVPLSNFIISRIILMMTLKSAR